MMPPQKKSIRDFFAPAPANVSSGPESRTTLPHRNASNTPTAQPNPPNASGLGSRATPNVADSPPSAGVSKRTTSNGKQVVLNSDSDDDSLPELDFGIPIPKAKPAPTTTMTTTITTRSKRMVEHDDDGLRKPTKKLKDDKRKFESLVQTAQQNVETERRIQEHKAALDKAEEKPVAKRTTMNEETLGQAVQDGDDADKVHRLFQAMQRTNTTHTEPTFLFFEEMTDTILVRSRFPIHCLPRNRSTLNFQEPNNREQAFMTGFAQHMFRMQELPKELASWMIEQFRYNENEALNYKYLEILQANHHHLHSLLDPDRLDALFKSIGASVRHLDARTELMPVSIPRSETKASLPPSLALIARLLASSAPWLHANARSHALYLLCHTCLDGRITTDADTLLAIQDAIEAVMCSFADNHQLTSGLSQVIPQLLARITHPVLQRNLTCALPARSPLTAYLQRYLALSFMVHPTPVNTSLADYTTHSLLMEHVATSPNFRISKDTNYGHLAARLALLDIAIGPGLLTVPYQPPSVPTQSQAGSCPMRAPVPASSEVKDFNKEIDALAQQIKLLGNSIVEAGAVVDITILETKDSVERMHARLEHALRIGGKKVHSVFGDDEEDTQLLMKQFFK